MEQIHKKRAMRRRRKALQLLQRKLTDTLYFIVSGLIFYGLVQQVVIPSVKGVYATTTDFLFIDDILTKEARAFELNPTPTPLKAAEDWDEFVKSAEEIAPIYNFPVKLLVSQAAHESARGTSHYAQERNNYFGMGCYDWNPDLHCIWYENEKQSIISYILNIRDTFPTAWSLRDKPEEMLVALQYNNDGVIYATDPDYVRLVMNTPEWRNY
jgi:hypothetical protein